MVAAPLTASCEAVDFCARYFGRTLAVPVRFKVFTTFFRLGDAILVIALTSSIVVVLNLTHPDLKSYAMNVSASFLFASIVRGVELYREIFHQISFILFFGNRIASNDFSIVYPEFGLDVAIRDLAKTSGISQQKLFVKNNLRNVDDTFRVDLESCAASNDLRAMIELSSLFAKRLHQPPKITPDRDWERILEDSFVSIGFSSNYLTHKWLGFANEYIKVADEDGGGRYGEYVRLNYLKDDADAVFDFKSTTKEGEIGLVVKFRPDPVDRPDIIWFLCAGIGGDATVASSIFLSRKWAKLLKIFGQDDFILILRTPPGVSMHAVPIFAVKNKQIMPVEALK
jgi:hypothetical protein